ncbi:cupin [Marinihelvus fidelis]|uniref:Cupin n=1 Tax=Marinihelvus fidelis TaxID=2613842 RepID=A0A5N0TG21_9GAMM|nr:cupin domain-containing protein [Marinihelvus fidelis]KAA9134103.1 cupin [Marinihelvus fidelis]
MTSIDFHALLDGDPVDDEPATPTPDGRELERLLSPLAVETFVNTYFGRESLNVEGEDDKFASLFGWAQLKRALARGRRIEDRRYNITASFTGGEASGNGRPMIAARHDQVSDLLTQGATLCITNIHMADPALARWAQAVRAQLNFSGTVGINCYVSPDGSGLPMHYDQRVATTVQIAGRKRWRFSTEAAKAWPDHNAVFENGRVKPARADGGRLPDEMTFREVELGPGDLLCLPAGAWHAARGVGVSLALNLYFAPRNFIDQLIPLFRLFASSSGDWRGGPPASAGDIHGDMPDNVADYMRERLDEFHAMARRALDGPAALAEPWLSALTQVPYTGWQPEAKREIPNISPEQRFRIPSSALRFVEDGQGVVVPCDAGLLRFPAVLAPLIRRLAVEAKPFTIPQVLAWPQLPAGLSREQAMGYLQKLYANGILEMA